MIKIKITAKDQTTWDIDCKDEQEVSAKIEQIKLSGIYGQEGEYQLVVEDVTAQLEAQAAKEAAKVARLNDLKAVDLSKITTIAGLKAVVQLLIDDKLK